MNNSISEGYMHSIYIKLTEQEYFNIYQKYATTNLTNQNYFMYANNTSFVVVKNSKPINKTDKTTSFESWIIDNDSIISYTMPYNDICYTVEAFRDRFLTKTSPINDVRLRFIGNGCWLMLDKNTTIFIGKTQQHKSIIDLDMATAIRHENNSRYRVDDCVSANAQTIDYNLDMIPTYFIMKLCCSSAEMLYGYSNVTEFARDHNIIIKDIEDLIVQTE